MSRILLLAPDLSRNPVYTAWQFSGALERLGHRCVVAGPATAEPWPPLAAELADAVVLGRRWISRAGWRRALELAGSCQAVYAFKALPTSLGLALALRWRRGIPVVLHLDDWDAGYLEDVGATRRLWYGVRDLGSPRGQGWLRLFEGLVGRADAVTVSSPALGERYGGTVVPQGVDTERLSPERYSRERARRRLGLSPEEPMVLFLGTPAPHKGLAALAALGEGRSGALWLVGAATPEWRAAGVPPALLEAARVRGPVSLEEAAWHMAACDVFVIPQEKSEFARHQLPAKLLQAMSLGCCVVATDVGVLSQTLGGAEPAGIVVPAGDPGALAAAVGRVLDDVALRRRLGERARDRAREGLGWRTMGERLAPILSDLGVGDA